MNINIVAFPNVQKESLDELVKSIKQTQGGFAGFKESQGLADFVKDSIFSESEEIGAFLPKNLKDIETNIVKALKLLTDKYTKLENIEIYIFPTVSDFVKNKMSGVFGFAPYAGVMHVYIHKGSAAKKDFSHALQETVAHEYNHLMRYENFLETETLLDDLIFEGLAENFKEDAFPGDPSPWAIALSKKEARKVFVNLKPDMQVKNYAFEMYKAIFFGNDEYKTWTGYSLGYYIVKDYLKTKKNIDWDKIMQTPAKEIASEANWL